jgi:hypothetical protein
MKCDGFQGSLFGDRGAAGFREHAAACAACAETLLGIEANERVLAREGRPAAPADLWGRIVAALAARPAPIRWLPLAAAAGFLLAMAVLLFPARRTLDIVVRDADSGAARAFGALVPRYDDGEYAAAPRGR